MCGQRTAYAPLHGYMPGNGHFQVLFALFHPLVADIRVHLGLLPTEHGLGLGDVVDVGGRTYHGAVPGLGPDGD